MVFLTTYHSIPMKITGQIKVQVVIVESSCIISTFKLGVVFSTITNLIIIINL